jgi:hypothetical protein
MNLEEKKMEVTQALIEGAWIRPDSIVTKSDDWFQDRPKALFRP